jgi:hypothetical protein
MTMKVPSQPTHLCYEDERLSFATPLYNGGGRISKYEVFLSASFASSNNGQLAFEKRTFNS